MKAREGTMKSTAKRILAALWIVGAFAGLLAVIVLPGRWDRGGPAGAHILAGIEIIDTQASCQSAAHNLNGANPTIAHATGTPGVTERQTITITGGPTGGDFTLTFSGQETAAIAFDANAGAVESALEALSNITDVTTGGGALKTTPITVDFIDPAGNVALMTDDSSGLTGGSSPDAAVVETIAGEDEVQTVTLANAVAGTFTLTFSGQTTAAIAYNASNATVETALEALSNITGLAVTGGPLPGSALTVTFAIPGGNVAEMTSDSSLLIGDCTGPNANADAVPTSFLVDSDGDTVVDAISVATGTTVRLVAHTHTGTDDAANGTDVTWTATGSAVFQAVGRDTNANGALDNSGDLTSITDTAIVIGDAVSDTQDGGTQCDAGADTCIDGDTTGGTGSGQNPDGIAIVEARSGLPTSSTITATTAAGTDSVTVIWTGAITTITVTATLDDVTDPDKLVAQSIIAQAGVLGGVFKGDPDLTITAAATDSGGNPVSGAQVDCALDTAGGGRADIGGTEGNNDETFDGSDNIADPGGNSVFAETTNAAGQVQMNLAAESEAGNSRGDVTVTCWEDGSGSVSNVLDGLEPNGSVTVRVSGPPATVALTGDATMGVGSQTLTAIVTDADGEAVANATNCTWLLIDPLTIAGLTSPTSGNAEGTTDNVSTNVLIAAAAGAVTVSVTCGTANDLLSITVSGVAPTPPPAFPPGDVNCDGSFTVADLLAAARALVGLDPALTAC